MKAAPSGTPGSAVARPQPVSLSFPQADSPTANTRARMLAAADRRRSMGRAPWECCRGLSFRLHRRYAYRTLGPLEKFDFGIWRVYSPEERRPPGTRGPSGKERRGARLFRNGLLGQGRLLRGGRRFFHEAVIAHVLPEEPEPGDDESSRKRT